eukprot:6212659-Pleurochrysis_carterae.AAC.2
MRQHLAHSATLTHQAESCGAVNATAKFPMYSIRFLSFQAILFASVLTYAVDSPLCGASKLRCGSLDRARRTVISIFEGPVSQNSSARLRTHVEIEG